MFATVITTTNANFTNHLSLVVVFVASIDSSATYVSVTEMEIQREWKHAETLLRILLNASDQNITLFSFFMPLSRKICSALLALIGR